MEWYKYDVRNTSKVHNQNKIYMQFNVRIEIVTPNMLCQINDCI